MEKYRTVGITVRARRTLQELARLDDTTVAATLDKIVFEYLDLHREEIAEKNLEREKYLKNLT